MSRPRAIDVAAARLMLGEGPQASYDEEAEPRFADLVGEDVVHVDHELRLHRRRIAALRYLVKVGEARSRWMGSGRDLTGGYFGPKRIRVYDRVR